MLVTPRGWAAVGEVRRIKVVLERHPDGFVAYPVGLKGVVVGQGDTFEEALADVKSAIRFHVETFGPGVFDDDSSEVEVFVSEAAVSV
jgi:predicted RNase H-like HicB family nuclease